MQYFGISDRDLDKIKVAERPYSEVDYSMKKKKEKMKRLRDEDYANYIMSLKDERPVKTIIPEEDRDK